MSLDEISNLTLPQASKLIELFSKNKFERKKKIDRFLSIMKSKKVPLTYVKNIEDIN